MKKITIGLWFLTILGLFFYSFTQVDLNLTLIRHPFINQIIKSFQYFGYFQRPLSTFIFLVLILLLFTLYFLLLLLAKQGKLTRKEFWLLTIFTSIILLFSYPAFSYDIFNYMFDAKTVMFYHANPWQYSPLYFTGDSWLHFMHWTHRPSIYPPGWILLSLPFFIAGLNYFVLILFNFKLLMALGFIGSVWLLSKLLSSTPSVILGTRQLAGTPESVKSGFWTSQNDEINIVTALVFYAFNPLMLIENLVSGHNDIVMMFFVLLSLWVATQKRKLLSVVCCLLSVLTKYVTGILMPIIVFFGWLQKKVSMVTIYRYSLILVFVAFCVLITKIEIQPWYLVWLMPFVVLSGWKAIWPVTIGFSLGLLLRYAPYLYLGNWNKPVPTYEFWLTLVPLIIALILTPLLMKKKII